MREITLRARRQKLWLVIAFMYALAARGGEPVNSPVPSRVLIAHDQKADCQIYFEANVTENAKESMLESVRRLQTYIYRLTGARPPVAKVDAGATNLPVAAIIYIDTEVWTAPRPYCYRIDLVLPSATSFYHVPLIRLSAEADYEANDTPEHKTLVKRGCVGKAIEAFVQQYFGVPLAAIDDPKFDWAAHRRGELAINYADFHPIQFPPEK
jgi:hypothetical protein